MTTYRPGMRLGILGGGQLGKMLIQEAAPFHLQTIVLDPADDAPARTLATHFETGDFTDFNTVYRFGRRVDALTYEIEKVNAFALMELQADGVPVFPDPRILRTVQDKRRQKRFFQQHGLPTAPFSGADDRSALAGRPSPYVVKAARGGYDGRGVAVIAAPEDLDDLFEGPYLVEDFVHVKAEVAVVVARHAEGTVRTYPPVMMFFVPEAHLLDVQVAPALLPEKTLRQAEELAVATAEAFQLNGVMAVEMFVDAHNRLLINEVAPRPHNSGHHTLKAAPASQFEQHLRAGLGLPLADVAGMRPAAMFNLLGDPHTEGPARYKGLEHLWAAPGVYPYLYGKSISKPYRKMGHVIVLADTPAEALQRARTLKTQINVYGGN